MTSNLRRATRADLTGMNRGTPVYLRLNSQLVNKREPVRVEFISISPKKVAVKLPISVLETQERRYVNVEQIYLEWQ